jgi:hypothetical protein
MDSAKSTGSSRDKVRAYRLRQRALGLRPVQIWVPDIKADGFRAEAHRQSQAVGLLTPQALEGQAVIDSLSDLDEA